MIIHIDQNGGFAGISKHMQLNTDKMTKSDASRIKKMLKVNVLNKNYSESKKKPLKGAADYYTYRITIYEGAQKHIIQCDEFNMEDDLKELVAYVERESKTSRAKYMKN